MSILPEGLRAWRSERGWSQKDLADRSGLSATLIAMIETGERQPGLSNAICLAKALRVPLRAFAILHVDVDSLSPLDPDEDAA